MFSALRASVWYKSKRGPAPRAPPLDPPLKKAFYTHLLDFYRPSLFSWETVVCAYGNKTPGDLLIPRATGWGCVKFISLCINIFASRSSLPEKGGIVLGVWMTNFSLVKRGKPKFLPIQVYRVQRSEHLKRDQSLSFTPLSRTIPPIYQYRKTRQTQS